MKSGFKTLWFLLHAIIGLYLINYQFKFIDLKIFSAIDGWIVLIGGILLIIAGVMTLRKSPTPYNLR
jgi:asparagine N-glycosylation enzyme membrane subunit Stt3